MSKPKKTVIHVRATYKGRVIDFYARTSDEVIAELLRWFKIRFDKEDWPYILKWVEGIATT